VQFTQVKKEMGSSMTGSDNNRADERAQFRRYAEAALAGLDHNNLDYDTTARMAFTQAIEMMMMENFYFEQYQLQALEHVVAKQRAKHGIEEPSEPSKVF
jgi:hypothetical protein